MDLGSVIGFVLMWALIIIAMLLGVGVGPYLDAQSVLIVIGGTIGAIMLGFKMETVKQFGKIMGKAFKPELFDIPELINKLVGYATQARRDGILALEGTVANETNEFLKKGLSMAVDGNEPDVIRELLEIDMEKTGDRHNSNNLMFEQLGGYAGAFGMAGTLVGLVAMLVNMSDPSSIGPAMAVALLTTLYGSLIGTIIANPVSNILKIRSGDEIMVKSIILEGIMSIQSGDNPRTLEAKLLSFLPPAQRTSQFE